MNPGTITFLKAVLEATWQGSLVILLVLLVRPLLGFRVPARWRSLLWMLVLIRLLVPAFILPRSPASLQNIAAVQRPITHAQSSLDQAYAEYVNARDMNAQRLNMPAMRPQGDGHPSLGETTVAPVVESPRRPIPWWEIAAFAWISGAILCAVWISIATIRLRLRLRRETGDLDATTISIWKSCCARFSFKHPPRLVVTSHVGSPALLGVWRPALLIPREGAQAFSPEDWEHIFMHELAHFRRRDHWTQMLQILALCVHWFNPLVWLGFRYLRADRELATDELALSQLAGDRSIAYGGTLLKVLSGRDTIALHPGLVGIIEDAAQLKQRLRRIVAFGPRKILGSAIGLGLTLVLAALVLGKETSKADLSGYAGMKPAQILVLAATKGDLPVVQKMLDDGAGIDSVVSVLKWEKKTPLAAAAAANQMDVVKFLVSKGAQLNPANDGTHSAVSFALQNGWPDCADYLISKGAIADPLALAAAKGDRVAIAKAIADGTQDFDHLKLLAEIAAVNGHVDIFSDLSDPLQQMNNPEYVNWDNSVAVRVVAHGHRDVFAEMIKRDPNFVHGVARYAGAAEKIKGMREWLNTQGFKVPEYTDNERLIDAAECQDLPEMRRLIKAGAKVNYNGEAGWSPLAKAAAWGQPLAVKLLLENKADPNSQKSGAYSALCLTDSPEIADMLLAAGADLNAKPKSMNNLRYAVSCCPDEKVKWYLDHGVDPTKVKGDNFEVTLLFSAHTPGIAEMLIAHGVDLNAKDGQGLTAMLRIEQMEQHSAEIVKVLLKHGADPNLKSKDGYTPLMAARDGDTVDVLIAAGADPAAKDDKGETALEIYVPGGLPSRTQALLRHGVKPDTKQLQEMLGSAVWQGPAQVKAALAAGANPSSRESGHPEICPLAIAIRNGMFEIAAVLRQAGSNDVGLFSEAAARGDVEKMKTMLAAGADVNERAANGDTPLIFATQCAQAKAVALLLDHGANPNLFDVSGCTPYWLVRSLAINTHPGFTPAGGGISPADAKIALDAIRALLTKAKIDVNYQDENGETMLFVGAAKGCPIWSDYPGPKFNVNVQRKDGMTALMIAVVTQPKDAPRDQTFTDPKTKKTVNYSTRGEFVSALLNLGADTTLKNNAGKTALDLAKENGNEEILALLQQQGK